MQQGRQIQQGLLEGNAAGAANTAGVVKGQCGRGGKYSRLGFRLGRRQIQHTTYAAARADAEGWVGAHDAVGLVRVRGRLGWVGAHGARAVQVESNFLVTVKKRW